jgi:hypothetical protein
MFIVNCYSDDGELVRKVQLSPASSISGASESKRTTATPPSRQYSLNAPAISPLNRKLKQTLEDTNRKLKILLKIQEENELERLNNLIDKWQQVGMQVLDQLKQKLGGNSDQVQRLKGREFAQYMGINEPKILKLLFPEEEADEDDGESESGEVAGDPTESQGFSKLNSDFFRDDDCT